MAVNGVLRRQWLHLQHRMGMPMPAPRTAGNSFRFVPLPGPYTRPVEQREVLHENS
jgi:hypothetical protein